MFLQNSIYSLEIRKIQEASDFHCFFLCSPDYYSGIQTYFYVSHTLKILLENLWNFVVPVNLRDPSVCLGWGSDMWQGCVYVVVFFFLFCCQGEYVSRKHEENQEGLDHLPVILVLFLTSDFSKSNLWNHVHAKLKKKARASKNFFIPYTHNHLSPQALTRLHNVQQLTLCCLFTIFCSKYQLLTEFTNERCIVLVSLTYKH